jgi:hypothetical protein
MRTNSAKQSNASRQNGAKSKGAVSTEGKRKVARNAVKDGIFSRQIVIPTLGESLERFLDVWHSFRDALQPSNAVEEQLVNDYVENWWRRERIRKAHTAELSDSLVSSLLIQKDRKVGDAEALTWRFAFLCDRYQQAVSGEGEQLDEIITELQDIRKKLLSTTFGIGYLIDHLEAVKQSVAGSGKVGAEDEAWYRTCSGFSRMPNFGLSLANPYTGEEYEELNKVFLEQMKKLGDDFRSRATPSQTTTPSEGQSSAKQTASNWRSCVVRKLALASK